MNTPQFYPCDLSKLTFTMSEAANPTHPLANLNDYLFKNGWQSSDSVDGQSLICNANVVALNNPNRNSLVVAGHNIQGIINVGGSVQVQVANTSAFTTGLTTLWDTGVGPPAITDPLFITFASTQKPWFRILYTTLGGQVPVVQKFFMGNYFDFGLPYDLPFIPGNRSYETTQKFVALDGTLRTSQAYLARWMKTIAYKSANGGVSDLVRGGFQTFFQIVQGRLRPFFFLDVDGSGYYVHLDIDIDPSQQFRYNINDIASIPMISQQVS